MTAPTVDRSFRALGTDVRVVVTAADAERRAGEAERFVLDYDARLSRFRPDSELSALNADPRERVPASPLLRHAVAAALWAAERSDGLSDPTLLDALEAAGYRTSLADAPRSTEAPQTGEPVPAQPDPRARWRSIAVDADHVIRPPGLRLDLGGSGKGHAADLVAALLEGAERWAIDCGGDVRVGGAAQPVLVAHPLSGQTIAGYHLAGGAVATSSVVARSWVTGNGGRAHHLIDPATRRPANTGLLSATALAPTTLEAETLAKAALLQGPHRARTTLAERGGLVVHAGGEVEHVEASA